MFIVETRDDLLRAATLKALSAILILIGRRRGSYYNMFIMNSCVINSSSFCTFVTCFYKRFIMMIINKLFN